MEFVLEEILKLTNDVKSTAFWEKAIKELGPAIVLEEVSETKYQTKLGNCRNPAKYLTALLSARIKKKPTENKKDKKQNYFEKTQLDLFQNLMPLKTPEKQSGDFKAMAEPYSGKNIPWPTFLGPEFFTLSTNKKKSDRVKMTSHAMDGSAAIINLIRGKISPTGKERGIPTVQHEKIFAALKFIWSQQGCRYTEFEAGTLICHVTTSARELAKTLGWKTFGGKELNRLKDSIMDLKAMPYYLDFTESSIKNIKSYYFTLIGDFSGVDLKKQGGQAAYFKISFSSAVSWQLLQRHAVMRSKNILSIRSELATLLWLYIEPILRTHKDFKINLKNLIKALQLPKAGWHNFQNKRKQQFEKAIKELNILALVDDHKIKITIEKGFYDWQLCGEITKDIC